MRHTHTHTQSWWMEGSSDWPESGNYRLHLLSSMCRNDRRHIALTRHWRQKVQSIVSGSAVRVARNVCEICTSTDIHWQIFWLFYSAKNPPAFQLHRQFCFFSPACKSIGTASTWKSRPQRASLPTFRWSHLGWFVGIKRSGKVKNAKRTTFPSRQKAIQFLHKMPYPSPTNIDLDLIKASFRAAQHQRKRFNPTSWETFFIFK